MVDLIDKIRFEVCGKKIIRRSVVLDFCAENPIKREDGKEDF